MGRTLILIGALLLVAGIVITVMGRFMSGPPRMPGDLIYRKGNFTFYFPIVTSIVLSVVLTLVMWLFNSRR